MDDFFKTKVGFSIGLLAVVFTIKPIVDAYSSYGFLFLGTNISVKYAYFFLTASLGLAVYFISAQFASEKHVETLNYLSDACYVFALVIPPLFVTLWIITVILDFIDGYFKITPDVRTVVTLLIAGYIAKYMYTILAKVIKKKFWLAEKNKERKNDIQILARASDLLHSGMYDLSVLESTKVVRTSLRRLLAFRGIAIKNLRLSDLLKLSVKHKIINKEDIDLYYEIRRNRNRSGRMIDSIDKSIAEKVLKLSRVLIIKLDFSEKYSGYEWLEKNRNKVLNVFKTGNARSTKKAVRMLRLALSDWDGDVSLEISEFFEVALMFNPKLIIDIFYKQNPSLLDSWLENSGVMLFTDFEGRGLDKLKKNKRDIFKSLNLYIERTENPTRKNIAELILEKIKSSEIILVN
ncbi:MAG: hypothetical protein GY760_00385 [Deltaproteobacteria bacterium]|nr:hypothetical protein [Deltaproteobacteria bacterium]